MELRHPHGLLLATGKKTAVLSPDDLPVGEALPVDGVGVVVLGEPARMVASEADRKEWYDLHRVRPDEREAWWPGEARFAVYPVERLSVEMEDWKGGEMPYELEERDGEYCVVKEGTDETVKCHPSKEKAEAHLAALRINVEAEEKDLQQELPAAEETEPQEPAEETDRKGQLKKLMQRVEDLEAELAAAKAKTKAEDDGEHPAGHYLVVEDPEKPSTWHLRVKDADGELDHRLMGGAWAALHGGYRGNKYQGPGKEEALAKLKKLYEAEGLDTPSEEKARGEGQGVGGEPQGDGGADVCVCPECGAESPHEKGTPCAELECPECGAAMRGADAEKEEKAGRRVKRTMRQRLSDAVETLKEVLGWAEYDDGDGLAKMMIDNDTGFAVKAGPDGQDWLWTWTTNAFKDRDEEIFATKGLERYVKLAEERGERGAYNLWHVKGTEFADVKAQAVIGRFLVEGGPFRDDAKGRAVKAFFEKYPDGHPEHAPEGWGCSPEFRYLPEERKEGVFKNFWITDRAVLPRNAAANVQTKGGSAMTLITKKNEEMLKEALGDEQFASLVEAAEEESKELEGLLAYKGLDGEKVAKRLRGLAGKAEGELKASLEALADEMAGGGEDDEEETEEKQVAPPQELDMGQLAALLAERLDVDVSPLVEEVEALRAEVKALKAKKARPEDLPRFVMGLEKRASQAEETELDDDDPLLKMGPKETPPDSQSGAGHFFPAKK